MKSFQDCVMHVYLQLIIFNSPPPTYRQKTFSTLPAGIVCKAVPIQTCLQNTLLGIWYPSTPPKYQKFHYLILGEEDYFFHLYSCGTAKFLCVLKVDVLFFLRRYIMFIRRVLETMERNVLEKYFKKE